MSKYTTSFNSNGSRYDRLDGIGFHRKDYFFICKYNKVDESLTVLFYTDIKSPELIANILLEIKNTIDQEVGRDEQGYETQN